MCEDIWRPTGSPLRVDIWFPEGDWPARDPADAGFDPEKLAAAGVWLKENTVSAYRVGVLRSGHQVVLWSDSIEDGQGHGIGSGQKTLYGSMIAVAVEEGKLGSPDDRVADTFPEMMDVPQGRGPREDRYATPQDAEITFRQLITNTSGYLKPEECPGQRFNYQTFGMNLLTHAIERLYGCYDPTTERPPFGALVQEKIGDPLGITFRSRIGNFNLPPEARIDVFGNAPNFSATFSDWGRVGAMWLNGGCWGERQVVPRQWIETGTKTSDLVKACALEEEWAYGYGWWSNDYDRRWPGLPRDSFMASGAAYNVLWVCPSLDLIVIQSPGGGSEGGDMSDPESRRKRVAEKDWREREILERIVDACA